LATFLLKYLQFLYIFPNGFRVDQPICLGAGPNNTTEKQKHQKVGHIKIIKLQTQYLIGFSKL